MEENPIKNIPIEKDNTPKITKEQLKNIIDIVNIELYIKNCFKIKRKE